MDNYKDFTVSEKAFPDFKNFVSEMKDNNIHLVPIIDAAVKKNVAMMFTKKVLQRIISARMKTETILSRLYGPANLFFQTFLMKKSVTGSA